MATKSLGKKLAINTKKLRPLTPSNNVFQTLVRSIIGQQISSKAAESIYKKFVTVFKPKKFPKPEDVLKCSDAKMRSAGLSGQKVIYLRDLAAKFLDKTIDPKKFSTMTDEAIIGHLVAVKGIGPWTAHMFLIFALNRPNVLPVGDLAIKKGFQRAFKLRTLPTEKKMRELARAHEGEHTMLSLHLWGLMDDGEDGGW